MTDTPQRLYKCTLTGHGVFFVISTDESKARKAVETAWSNWGYTDRKGRVVKIEVLAEEGQYPSVPTDNVLGSDTWLLP